MSVRYSVAFAAVAAFSVLLHGEIEAQAGAKNYSRYHVQQAGDDGPIQVPVLKRRRPVLGPTVPPVASSPPQKSTEPKKKQNLKSIFELIKEEAKPSRRKQVITAEEIDTYETLPQPPRKKQKPSKQAHKGMFRLIKEEARKSTAESNTAVREQSAAADEESDKKRKKV